LHEIVQLRTDTELKLKLICPYMSGNGNRMFSEVNITVQCMCISVQLPI